MINRHKPRMNAKRSITTLCSREAMPKTFMQRKQFYTKCSPCEFSIITDALNHSHTLSCLISELFTHEKDFRRYTHHRNILC